MPLPVQKFREAVFQILFSKESFLSEDSEIVAFMMQELKTTRSAMDDATKRANQILNKQAEIDPIMGEASTEYTVERISRVEKTILRLALFEMLFDENIPPKVAIAEAIRLCRKFGTRESAQFVNAILDKVYKNRDTTPATEPVPC